MVPAGNKTKRLSLVNHTAKTIHHLHHHLSFSPTTVEKKFFFNLARSLDPFLDCEKFIL